MNFVWFVLWLDLLLEFCCFGGLSNPFIIICQMHYWGFCKMYIEIICLLNQSYDLCDDLFDVKCPKAQFQGSILLLMWIITRH